jgi:hypothetical protein
MICLLLTIRMAHKSLVLKLQARSQSKKNATTNHSRQRSNSISFNRLLQFLNEESPNKLNSSEKSETVEIGSYENVEMKMAEYNDCNEQIIEHDDNFTYKRPKANLTRSSSAISVEFDARVDKIYTVGCFDLFHHGHVRLIERMREFGKKVIVGVHDSRRYVANFE